MWGTAGSYSTLLPPTNEVCEGYVFTHVCQSFCSRGGEYLGRYPPGTKYTPRTRYTSWDQVHPLVPGTAPGIGTPLAPGTPSGPGTPPRTRYPQTRYPPGPGTPQDQVHPLGPGRRPGTRYTTRTRYPPEQCVLVQAGGTHPTGMHSCFSCIW